MTVFVRAYLRASTKEQDADRARKTLEDFAQRNNLDICNFYIENESGAKLQKPELFRLLGDCTAGDILLIEDIHCLSRLNGKDWEELKQTIRRKDVRIVAVNVPTTHTAINSSADDVDNRMVRVINEVLIEVLAAVTKRDYDQRRYLQAQGIAKAKKEGKFKGKKIDEKLYKAIISLSETGHTYQQIIDVLSCSSTTISRAKRWNKSKSE